MRTLNYGVTQESRFFVSRTIAMNAWLKTAEFARLCATTKETLLHYDRFGILKPAAVHDNGYRYYRAEQFFLFSLISTLSRSGVSLSEVRELLSKSSQEEKLAAISHHVTLLKEETQLLLARQSLLESLLESTQDFLTAKHGAIQIEHVKKLTLRLFSLEADAFDDDVKLARAHGSCVAWDEAHVGMFTPPSGSVYRLTHEKKGFKPLGIFTREAKGFAKKSYGSWPGPVRLILPEGDYATSFVRTTTEKLQGVIADFLKKVRRKHFAIEGHIFVFDEMNYLLPSNQTEEYEVRIMVALAKKTK